MRSETGAPVSWAKASGAVQTRMGLFGSDVLEDLGAGSGNRTRTLSLEGSYDTISPYPLRVRRDLGEAGREVNHLLCDEAGKSGNRSTATMSSMVFAILTCRTMGYVLVHSDRQDDLYGGRVVIRSVPSGVSELHVF